MKPTETSQIPKQSAPVQRPSISVAMLNQNGIEASGSSIFELLKHYPIQ